MCGSCITSWNVCACDGGSVFGVCPCAKGIECPICDHYPNKLLSASKINLANLLKPALLKKERARYKKAQKKHKAAHAKAKKKPAAKKTRRKKAKQ
ncbi:MAG: hypothetical protein DYH13_01205 [Alphaproteobacteria bacterium PRO2]|nr:hypothetical protein [Alphaproteobacteria bacterium PRO2]